MARSARSLYVIGAEDGPLKIGISTDVGGRLAALQSHSPHALVAHHQAQPGDARLVERVAHQLLAAKRVRGEWFDVSIDDAVAAINQAIALVESGDLSLLRPPGADKMTTSIRIHPQKMLALKRLAHRRRVRVNALIDEAIDHFLEMARRTVHDGA